MVSLRIIVYRADSLIRAASRDKEAICRGLKNEKGSLQAALFDVYRLFAF